MRRTALCMLVLAGLLCGACVVAFVDPAAQGRYWPLAAFRKSLDLKPGGSVALENGNGDIVISGGESDKVEINAQRGGQAPPSPGIHFIGQKFSPPDVHVRAASGSVTIKTSENGYGGEKDAVDYLLHVPRFANLDSVRNGRGRVSISDVHGRSVLEAEEGEVKISRYSGSLDIRLGGGNVQAEVLDLKPQDSVRIKVERGDIVLLVEPDASARLTADAPAGKVTSEFDLGQPLPAQKVTARLAEGMAVIELAAVRGDISIRKVEKTQ